MWYYMHMNYAASSQSQLMRWRRRVCPRAFGGGCVSKAKSGEGRRSFFFFFWGVNLILNICHLKIVPLVIQGKPSSLSAELSNEAVTKQEVCDACRWNTQIDRGNVSHVQRLYGAESRCLVMKWNEAHSVVRTPTCFLRYNVRRAEWERERERRRRGRERAFVRRCCSGLAEKLITWIPRFHFSTALRSERALTAPVTGASIRDARGKEASLRRFHRSAGTGQKHRQSVRVCVCVCAGVRRAKAALGYFWHRGAASCTLKGQETDLAEIFGVTENHLGGKHSSFAQITGTYLPFNAFVRRYWLVSDN